MRGPEFGTRVWYTQYDLVCRARWDLLGSRAVQLCSVSSRHAVRRQEFEAWRAVFEPFFTIDVLIDEDAIRDLPGLPPMQECGFKARGGYSFEM